MDSKRPASTGSIFLCGVATFALLLCVALPASAQTWTVIHNFNGLDGSGPSGLTIDAVGNLYGAGGGGGPARQGTVFKLARKDTGWAFTPLYHFNGSDGAGPSRVMFGPDGALYGTTAYGASGHGNVYRLQPPRGICTSGSCPWTETVLYSFQGGSDGGWPSGDLAFDRHGNIYGTTLQGGLSGCYETCGVVYELARFGGSWSYSVIYSFQGSNDGGNPNGGVVVDAAGNLYGTVEGGYYSNGAVFMLAPSASGWTETTLFAFPADRTLGIDPEAGLLMDASGNLYGTTQNGGQYGAGTVYELAFANGGWEFALLAALPYPSGQGSDAALAMDGNGNLYGTAWLGNVFKLTPSGDTWILTQLGQGDIGIESGVVVDGNGVVYGTNAFDGYFSDGTIFEIVQ